MYLKVKNPILSFILRLFVIILLSSFIWLFAVYYYHEYHIVQDIQKNIELKKTEFLDILGEYPIEKIDSQKLDILKQELEQKSILFAKLYDQKENKIIDIDFHQKNNLVPRDKITLSLEKLTYQTFMETQNEIYLLFQTPITIKNNDYHVVLLLQLDQNTIDTINEDVKFTLLIVIITTLLIFVTILPLIYIQYKTLVKSKNQILEANVSILLSLGNAIAKRDSDTNEHNYRVTYYSIKIAESMNLSKTQIQALVKGAFLHDIGKIAISDTILLKPSKLTEKEFEIMKTHVNHGLDIVKNIKWLQDASVVIQNHHEKVDGSGYPNGLKKDDIPIEARIFAVADVFDALTSKRPYKEAFSSQKSFFIINENINTHFDSEVVSIFQKTYQRLYNDVKNLSPEDLKTLLINNVYEYFINRKDKYEKL